MIWDGLFHALMYVLAVWGIALLWRHRQASAQEGSRRALLASALIGFGLWHLLDAVVSTGCWEFTASVWTADAIGLGPRVALLFGVLFLYFGWRLA